jgi:hypothetical protein
MAHPFFDFGEKMPVYSMKNTQTNEEFEVQMKISEKEIYLKENPHITQILTTFPGLSDPGRLGIRKPDDNFRDVLKNIKSHHKHNTINSF